MSTLKPFNLQAALKGAPVITRDGRKVIRIAHFPEAKHNAYQVVYLTEGSEEPSFACEDGRFARGSEDKGDLFMAPKIKTMYTEILCGEDGKPYNVDLKETLNEIPKDGVIATVTWEEPE